MTERERLMQAVVEAARKTAREIGATQSLFDALSALDAHPPEDAGEVVKVRAAVFSNGGEAWTVYGSSHTSDATVVANAESDLLDGGDEEHVGWIKGTLVLPKRALPEVVGEVEQ